MDTFFLFKADVCCPLSLGINKREQRKRREKNRETYPISLFIFFLLFLHAGKILILIKNNLKNTKNILTVRFNSV